MIGRAIVLLSLVLGQFLSAASPELLDVRKIWDRSPHNAFTDLLRVDTNWFCVFREGQKHVSPDGAIRILHSVDRTNWTSAARVTSEQGDLRDPKITLTPSGEFMLTAAVASKTGHRSLAWFSAHGERWSSEHFIGESNVWIWRTAWHEKVCYGFGYGTGEKRYVRLYTSRDGRQFEPHIDLFTQGYPNETAALFQPDGTALCLLRQDGTNKSGQLGHAQAPYTRWTWDDLGVQIGGPQMVQLPDGRIIAAVRLSTPAPRTALAWIDRDPVKLTEFLPLPSGGDTSYAGMVWHEGLLTVSYYSSHEGKTAIYLATVRVPPVEQRIIPGAK